MTISQATGCDTAESGLPAQKFAIIDGLGLNEGMDLLAAAVDEIHWLDRSPFLAASAHPAFDAGCRPELYAVAPFSNADGSGTVAGRGVCVAFAPEHGRSARDWAAARDLPLLAPDPAASAIAADKLDAMALFAEADVETPEFVRVPSNDRAAARQYWPDGWQAAVVQRRENNLIGRGTRLVRDPQELQGCLDDWAGRELRVARYVDGPSVTVTACVAGNATIVSAVSHQLVGIPGLTTVWGAHCGNQLIAPADLPDGSYEAIRAAAARVGDRLRRRGFRGVFGLDLVLERDRPLAIEINPRFQTVVSLVQAVEQRAGLLPCLGLHVLACLLPELPVQTVTAPVPTLGQLVVHADRDRRLGALPESGTYRLIDDIPVLVESLCLTDLSAGHALLWAQTESGTEVRLGDELVLIQVAEAVASLQTHSRLTPAAADWVTAVTAYVEGS
ncbi:MULTISPECIES: ATP-grasp domain-containing protein [unclassified Nocardia]|uniref:ATP-grasp domain-containing protein n=1 Tax=unclassified Nocardia TaxID=2637762 RepID=UPI001CE4670A|nr:MULTISPECIES: ATP-grasp domain-containing protein [unclassified Nocardia]